MDRPSGPAPQDIGSPFDRFPTGGVTLTVQQLKALAPAWEITYRSIRGMDELDLGEIELAGVFVWREEP